MSHPATDCQVIIGYDHHIYDNQNYINFIELLEKLLIIAASPNDVIDLKQTYQALSQQPMRQVLQRHDSKSWNLTAVIFDFNQEVYQCIAQELKPSIFSQFPENNFLKLDTTNYFQIEDLTDFYQTLFPNDHDPAIGTRQKLQKIHSEITTKFNAFKKAIKEKDLKTVELLHFAYQVHDRELIDRIIDRGTITITYNATTNLFTKNV